MTYELSDLTISEVLRDPLIRQMLRADGVSLSSFAVLLDDVARERVHRSYSKAMQMSGAQLPAAHVIDNVARQICCVEPA
ncbi:hypothetical protein NAC44_16910 [Allorhizobium sp. BGMRC 0089]|uniref:hypothetical protein n=1 Tax=Allorhizobium sonneratiae TaxID=2934936 RepID=UPI0020349A02|nr:hypothetical protein [Allorhizobium sonneratiae]MCM2294008.1 hypothetical protein [Allorhizobium sonneratiae]